MVDIQFSVVILATWNMQTYIVDCKRPDCEVDF